MPFLRGRSVVALEHALALAHQSHGAGRPSSVLFIATDRAALLRRLHADATRLQGLHSVDAAEFMYVGYWPRQPPVQQFLTRKYAWFGSIRSRYCPDADAVQAAMGCLTLGSLRPSVFVLDGLNDYAHSAPVDSAAGYAFCMNVRGPTVHANG